MYSYEFVAPIAYVFWVLKEFVFQVFDEVESLPLFAFDHGLGDIICSVISVLNADVSSVQ